MRAAVDPPVTLHAAKLDAGAHQPRADLPVAELVTDREPLQLGEAREIADAQAADRLLPDIGEQVTRREIVAVEFLLIGAILFGDEGGAAHRHHPHEILDRAHHGDGDVSFVLDAEIVVVDRTRLLIDSPRGKMQMFASLARKLAP